MRVVVATDKFKGSLTAAEVAESLDRGLRRVVPDVEVVRVPVADGGDGTLDAFVVRGVRAAPGHGVRAVRRAGVDGVRPSR